MFKGGSRPSKSRIYEAARDRAVEFTISQRIGAVSEESEHLAARFAGSVLAPGKHWRKSDTVRMHEQAARNVERVSYLNPLTLADVWVDPVRERRDFEERSVADLEGASGL